MGALWNIDEADTAAGSVITAAGWLLSSISTIVKNGSIPVSGYCETNVHTTTNKRYYVYNKISTLPQTGNSAPQQEMEIIDWWWEMSIMLKKKTKEIFKNETGEFQVIE